MNAPNIHQSTLMNLGLVAIPEMWSEPVVTYEKKHNSIEKLINIAIEPSERKALRANIRIKLAKHGTKIKFKTLYLEMLRESLIPKRHDGNLLSLNGFSKYVIRAKKDISIGISDKNIVEMFDRDNKSINCIAQELGISGNTVRNILISHGFDTSKHSVNKKLAA